jgi:hypothetical protein
MAIGQVADRIVGKQTDDLFANMGKTWDYLLSDPQLRWYVPLRMANLHTRRGFIFRISIQAHHLLSEIPLL